MTASARRQVGNEGHADYVAPDGGAGNHSDSRRTGRSTGGSFWGGMHATERDASGATRRTGILVAAKVA